jgi:hypothetical protein
LDLTAPAAYKRILIVDDDPDTTFAYKLDLEGYYHDDDIMFFAMTLVALSEFKPHFYDLLLTNINLS